MLKLARANSDTPEEEAGHNPDLDMTPNESDEPLPLRSVLTKPVVVTVANYAMLALLNSVTMSYIPLVWSTPVEYGGLNLSPASIGLGLSVYGGMGGFFHLVFFSHLVSQFGLRRVFVFGIVSSAVIYVLFPFENLAVGVGGDTNPVVWLLIILQVASLTIFDMGYCEFFFHSDRLVHADTHEGGSLRRNERVHFICRSEQTVARCCIWPCACCDVGSERRWASYWGLAVCVFLDA